MGERFVELHSPEVKKLAYFELTSRLRQSEAIDGLSPGATRVLVDQRVDALVPQLMSSRALRVMLDLHALNFHAETIELRWQEEMLLQYFVLHQASVPMIRSMFPSTSRGDVEKLRAKLNAPPTGKAAAVRESDMTLIYSKWMDLQSVEDVRDRYFRVHQSFPEHTMTTLFAVLNIHRS